MNGTDTTAYGSLIREFGLLVDEPMKKYTSFKIGGPADLLALPKDKKEFINLFQKTLKFLG